LTSIAFIVNGGRESAIAHRARALAEHLRESYDISLAYREGNRTLALFRFLNFLRRTKPQVTYVFDMSYSGVFAGWLYRLLARNRLVLETGDVIYELMRSTGNRGPLGLWLTRRLEKFSLKTADHLVVRGRFHQQWLSRLGYESDVIQDGVDTGQFTRLEVEDLRREHRLNESLTVGLVGSSVWSEKLSMCYGWELIEMLRLLKQEPVKGVIIGDGSGIPRLKARCHEYGIEEKVLFLGYVPYKQLPRYLNLIDVCLSTQTNDLVGQVRTSGKLPLYLATGRYVLASEVGEAALVLDSEMLIPYEGVQDKEYPEKLARKIKALLAEPKELERAAANITLAKEFFEYSKLARRLESVIESVLRADKKLKAASPQQRERRVSAEIKASEKSD
jgi:glycosyltransferase involved in cell wall biosynthesis